MSFIMNDRSNEVKVAVKAADYGACADVFYTLMMNMQDLIGRCDATEEEKTKLRKDIYTDVVIPGLKSLYRDALDYILWGHLPRRDLINHSVYHRYARVERDYTEDEEEDSDDE